MLSDLRRRPLRADALRRALLAPGGRYAALDVVDSVDSTNTALAAAARDGAEDRTVLVAEHQTAGRGRVQRHWVAPPRSGLALSVLLRPAPVPQARWGWLPLLAGVALCRTVSTLGELAAVLKWPNDLLLGPHRRKAAGILAEVVPGPAVVLGIGLNVTMQPEELPAGTGPAALAATSLAAEQSRCTDRDALLWALLVDLDEQLRSWTGCGGDPVACGLREAYRQRCATLGAQIRVELPDGSVLSGTAVDIDAEGRLVIRSHGRTHLLAAGDVSHVRTP